MSEAMLCVRGGVVSAIVVIGDDEIYRETILEWASDPATEAMLRVDIDTARAAFLRPVTDLLARSTETAP